jgi:uncharacterized SAM-binding protein YcdF (DUF218 family)
MSSVRRGVFTRPRRDWGRVFRRLVAWGIVVGGLAAWVLTAGRWLDHPVAPKHPDAVFVLSDFGERRGAREGAALVKGSKAGRVIVFVGTPERGPKRATVRALQRLGVPASDIRVLGPVHSTDDEAKFAAGLVNRCHWESIAVVTAPFHTRRAGFLFRRAVKGRAEVASVSNGERYPASSWFLHAGSAGHTLLEWGRLLLDGRYLLQTPLAKGSQIRC